MSATDRTTLKNYFLTELVPTQSQFGDVMDSFADNERRVGTTSSVGATTLVLDAVPIWTARLGKIAIGVGLNTCEIREVSSISTATLTLNDALFNAHTAGERVLYFQNTLVSPAWWACKGSDTTYDNLIPLQCALRAIGRAQSTGGSQLVLDGQWRDYWISGPVCIDNGTRIWNQRWRAMTTAYTGPMDGPENATYSTNSMVQLGQVVYPYTYSSGTNTFTATTAAGVATATGFSIGTRIVFDSDGTVPTGLIPGRRYIVSAVPTSSTFQITLIAGGSTIAPLGSDGAGWVHGGLDDNVKFYSNSFWLDGSEIGLMVATAAASTDFITVTGYINGATFTAHGISNGDAVRLTWLGSGTAFPVGISQNVKYYASAVTATTLKVAATNGGAAIDITVDGALQVRRWDKCLNGITLGLQQPSSMRDCRVDGFKGFGVRTLTQQSYWSNLELINNGANMEFGGEIAAELAEFVWISGVDSEQADHTDFLFRTAKNIHIEDTHIEETGTQTSTVFDIACVISGLIMDGTSWITAGDNKTIIKVHSGTVTKSDYRISKLRGTFPTSTGLCVAIDDRDRGTYLDMWDHFGGEGIANYETWSTGDLSRTDPHPYRWDGIDGQSEWRGSGYATYPYRVTRHGAAKTSDIEQFKAWVSLTGTITLDLTADTFTRNSHGFIEGQEIWMYSGSSQTATAAEPWISSTIYRVRNPSANAFQISHTPVSPVLDFTASGNLTNWQVRSVDTLRLRTDKDARHVIGQNTAIADADVGNGEASWYWDAVAGLPRFKGKLTGGTVMTPNQPFVVTTTGINAKSVATTTLYTVPAGFTAIVTGAVVRCTAATSITVPATAGVGVAAGEADMFSSTALTNLTTTSAAYGFVLNGATVRGAAADVIKLGIDVAATGTSQTIAVDLTIQLI